MGFAIFVDEIALLRSWAARSAAWREADFTEHPEPVAVEVGFNSCWGMEEWDDHRLFVNRFERNAMLTHQILREDQMRLYPDVTIRDTSGFGTVMVTPGVLQPPVLPRPESWGVPC
jgi:hypothetical protein